MKRVRFTRRDTLVDKEVVAITREAPDSPYYWIVLELTEEEIDEERKYAATGDEGIFGTSGTMMRDEVVVYSRPGFDAWSDETQRIFRDGSNSKYRWEKVDRFIGVVMTLQFPTLLSFYGDENNAEFVSILEDIEE